MTKLLALFFLTFTSYLSFAQNKITFTGKIEYTIFAPNGNQMNPTNNKYSILFNDSILRMKLEAVNEDNTVQNIIKASIVKENPDFDSIEINSLTKKRIEEIEAIKVKNYYLYSLKKYGFNYVKKYENYLALDDMKEDSTLEISITSDTSTIMGIMCQKFIAKNKKGVLHYWVSTKIPISVNMYGRNLFPGITLMVEDKEKTFKYEVTYLEYPLKELVVDEFDLTKTTTIKEYNTWQNEKRKEASKYIKQ